MTLRKQSIIWTVRNSLFIALACLVAVGFAPLASAQGVDNPAIFELEGNTADEAPAGDDWDPAPGGGTVIPIQDPTGFDDDVFTGGGSKDINDVSEWMCKTAKPSPDKNNLLQGGAVIRTLPNGDTAIYFFTTRFANNGDAQMGFWLVQGEPDCMADGTFGAGVTHVDGDLLVIVNFSGGGTTPNIEVWRWQGGAGGGVVQELGLVTGECGVGVNAGNHEVCAVTNAGDSPAPGTWGFVPKFGSAGTFPEQSFFEGGINLTSVFGAEFPCFTTFIAETRSSTSITAQQKDLISGGFPLCSVALTKNCSSGVVSADGTSIDYTVSGLVTNDGPGPLFDIIVEEDPGDCADDFVVAVDLSTQTIPGQLGSGDSVPWMATVTSTETSCLNTAVAKAKPSVTATVRTVISDPANDPCTTPISNDISVDKFCDPGTSLAEEGGQVVVEVGVSGQVCNLGDSQLTGVTLAHDPSATVNLSSSTLAPAGETGECATWDVTYQPGTISSGDGTIAGRYFFDDEIRVTAATATLGADPDPAVGCPEATDLACATAMCAMCPDGSCDDSCEEPNTCEAP